MEKDYTKISYYQVYDKVSNIINDYVSTNQKDIFEKCTTPNNDNDNELTKFKQLLENANISNKEKIKLYLCAQISISDEIVMSKFDIIKDWINKLIPNSDDPILKNLWEEYNKNIKDKYQTIKNNDLIYIIQNCIL